MAIQTGIVIFKKRIGNVVGRKNRNSEYLLSKYQPTVHDANTQNQQQIRAKFKMLVQFASKCNNLIAIGLKTARRDAETIPNAFTRLNFENGFTGTWPNYSLNFSKLTLSHGKIDNPYNTAAQVQGSDLNFSWTDNSGIGNAMENDKVMFFVYNVDKNQAVYDTAASDRSSRQTTYTLPTAWTGDKIEVYFAMQREAKEASDSLFLGEFTL